ncbi:MAG: hypothetical protein JNJ57_00285 [Saprospiraceae bacterium]|nr:hypothetical protein [Saprospiraceae bacterium]
MAKPFLHGILKRYQLDGLIQTLSSSLPGTLSNSVLLEVFHQKTLSLSPKEILQAYEANRFVQPSNAPFFKLQELKIQLLQKAAEAGFEPLQLSPVSPLGTCSVVGPTHQNKIVSATRGTEVVADATNVLALETAFRRKKGYKDTIKLCTTHRHVRAQKFDFKGFTPHFDIFCMTTSGRDTGNYTFESLALSEHLKFYHAWAASLNLASGFRVAFFVTGAQGAQFYQKSVEPLFQGLFPFEVDYIGENEEPYYNLCRAKVSLTFGETNIEIIDCGFTDWTAKLCANRKERMLISGLGVELVAKLTDTL